MNLFTSISKYHQLLQNGLDDQTGRDHIPVVKFYAPETGMVWLLTEVDLHHPHVVFGMRYSKYMRSDIGYFDFFGDLLWAKENGIAVKEDHAFNGKLPISVYTNACDASGHFVDDENILKKYIANSI